MVSKLLPYKNVPDFSAVRKELYEGSSIELEINATDKSYEFQKKKMYITILL